MDEIFARNVLYWGDEAQKIIASSHIAVFGLGGVGGFCAEALARSGVGEQYKCSDNCGIDTCECDRWVEIWNLVFTELYQDEEGNQSPLEHKNVDTGMGLERITMVCQGVASTFETDLLRPILDKVSEMSGVPYKKSEKTDISLRIITDHARCVSFLISDGVIPAKIYDISANGIRLELDKDIKIPESVTLDIQLPPKSIKTSAKYIRTEDEDNILKASFFFINLPEASRDIISQKCIQKQLENKRNSII